MNPRKASTVEDLLDPTFLLMYFEARATLAAVAAAGNSNQCDCPSGVMGSRGVGGCGAALSFVRCATCHTEWFLLLKFVELVNKAKDGGPGIIILLYLCGTKFYC